MLFDMSRDRYALLYRTRRDLWALLTVAGVRWLSEWVCVFLSVSSFPFEKSLTKKPTKYMYIYEERPVDTGIHYTAASTWHCVLYLTRFAPTPSTPFYHEAVVKLNLFRAESSSISDYRSTHFCGVRENLFVLSSLRNAAVAPFNGFVSASYAFLAEGIHVTLASPWRSCACHNPTRSIINSSFIQLLFATK